MQRTVFAILIVAVVLLSSVLPIAAQDTPRRAARPVDPLELGGPPKTPPVVRPALQAFFQAPLLKDLESKDPTVLAGAIRDLSTFISQYPNEPDFYLLRATISCQNNGNKAAILDDIEMSTKLWIRGNTYVYDSMRDRYTLKSKVEFDLGRYRDAMNDLDASVREDYSDAEAAFNDGNVKPNQPTSGCVWTQDDLNTLARVFPNDFRPPQFIGLYLLQFAHYSLDADYQPILRAFEKSAALKPSSPLPFYFSAQPYVIGGIGGLFSKASATCIDDVVPRTKACLALDDIHRMGVRFLTRSIASDPMFAPAYELRATALFELRESRQAIRDFSNVLELNPKANIYNDRALAEMDLGQYQTAISDYTKAIERGCDKSLCRTYENRANAYLKIRDYPHAISDISHAIRNFLSDTIYGFNIDQFRRIYPEYDDLADDVLCEKLRALFMPQMNYATYSKQFLIDAKEVDDFVLPELFLKRGDAYADMGDATKANREYDRVSKGYPKWAETAFTVRNGRRIRNRQ